RRMACWCARWAATACRSGCASASAPTKTRGACWRPGPPNRHRRAEHAPAPLGSAVQAAEADVLGVHVLVDAVARAFTAHARLLDAAEGRHRGADEAGIDAHHAGFDGIGHAPHAREIAREEVGGQAELAVVGDGDGF